jgi:hypothetical protein
VSADGTPRFSSQWLGLREGADADARAQELVDQLAGVPRPVILDLGCGTGSMGRWLAGRLPGPQHWIMYDRDPALLEHAAAHMPDATADGSGVTVQTRHGDITRLTATDLAGASLITASALLDLLTVQEVTGLAEACAGARCPALLTLSVVGRVAFTPSDPLDAELTAAFNAHQRRIDGGRLLLGPDAVDAAADAFTRLGATVLVRPSPWRLGAQRAALTVQWLRGWVDAACTQQPSLAGPGAAYLRRRLAAAEAGELSVMVDHGDLLARFD